MGGRPGDRRRLHGHRDPGRATRHRLRPIEYGNHAPGTAKRLFARPRDPIHGPLHGIDHALRSALRRSGRPGATVPQERRTGRVFRLPPVALLPRKGRRPAGTTRPLELDRSGPQRADVRSRRGTFAANFRRRQASAGQQYWPDASRRGGGRPNRVGQLGIGFPRHAGPGRIGPLNPRAPRPAGKGHAPLGGLARRSHLDRRGPRTRQLESPATDALGTGPTPRRRDAPVGWDSAG